MTILLWVVSVAIVGAQGFLQYPGVAQRLARDPGNVKAAPKPGGDAGDPLFLTPYITSGRASEARQLARVKLPNLTLDSYAGFFTVNATHNSNQFLWYFPSVTEAKKTAPVLVWLQGGPGGSSLFGLFIENGPLEVRNGRFAVREHHWALNHHLLYIDNPVGAGFSFTQSEQGYCTDEVQVGEQLHSTLTQFFQLFPELQKNKFFLSGESYAGKFIPAVAYTIHKKNPTATTKINLQGMAIGNGWCDPEHQLVYSEYLYQIGLIDWNEKEEMKTIEDKAVEAIKNKDWYAKGPIIDLPSEISIYNYWPSNKHMPDAFEDLIQSSEVRKAIHVGDQPFVDFRHSRVINDLSKDHWQSVAPWISELLDYYSVVTYNGQFDIIVAYPLTVNFLHNLRFNGSEEYENAKRREWRVGGKLAGFVKSGGRLTEVMVRGAGHLVPMEQPEWALDLITRVTHGGFQ